MIFSGLNSNKCSQQKGFTVNEINYNGNANAKVRWVFVWNNESDQLSKDDAGGIKIDYLTTNYSADDAILVVCGISELNRSAGAELFIR